MKTYIFVGTDCICGDRNFDQFGQMAQFTDEQYAVIVAGGGAFIPKELFDKFGLTTEQIAAFGPVVGRMSAPPEFHEAVMAAEQAFVSIREAMLREGEKSVLSVVQTLMDSE